MSELKVMTIFGTRPEAVKMAPLVRELQNRPGVRSICCVTAQHREMLDSVLDIFRIRPDYDLDIMRPRQSLTEITTRCLAGMEQVLEKASPDLVLVHGDTSTTFSGALAAFYRKIKVGHVEAGLRTFDKYSPFPEEMNRRLTGAVSDLHFCPTAANAENLRREGIGKGVFITGNTVIDALKTTVRKEYRFVSPELEHLSFADKRVIVVTAHRRENYGEPMENIMLALRDLALKFEDVELVYPVHLSPAVGETAGRILSSVPRVRLVSPVSAEDMHNLMARCYMVLTDSGGLQEEAPALGKPVLVLRRETERPEAVAAGTVKLAGVCREDIFRLASELLTDPITYSSMARAVNPYGDGFACRRIADAVLWSFGHSETPPEEFKPR